MAATLEQYEQQAKKAMRIAHQLTMHVEAFAEGYLSDLKWRTLEAKHKAGNLEKQLREADQELDRLAEELGILDW